MPRSICGKTLVGAAAACVVLAAAALPARSAERAAPRSRPAMAASSFKTAIDAYALEDAVAAGAKEPTLPPRKVANPRRTRVVTTQFKEEPVTEPVPEMESKPRKFVKPFRQIAEILPYDTYDPISTAAERERCPTNLCPCPEGAECPECCPDEDSLRRLGREKGEPDRPFIPRDFAHIHYCWEPTNMYHYPIYFEDVPLERYGHTRHYLIQPFFSGAKFAVQLLGLPYQMTLDPVCSRQYSLGYYRPGECAPYKYYQIPLNAEAALVEAGVITGGYFLFAPGVGP
ncbi:MAG: hypothetical protein ACM3U2_22935 [Deltaproteobacteria bacterium]